MKDKKLAFAEFLGLEMEDIDMIDVSEYDHFGLPVLSYQGEHYAITDDHDKVEKAMEEEIDRCITISVLPQIGVPQKFYRYFDRKKFIEDEKIVGAKYIAFYDGKECTVDFNGRKYYIYRLD